MKKIYFKLLILLVVAVTLPVLQSYAFLDDFERAKFGADWQKSPVGQDASWSIDKGEAVFNGVGGQSQMMTGKADWKDYTVECDIKLTSAQEYPGGIRTYVDASTGGHYAVWVYPVQKKITLYSGTSWDINTGIVNLDDYKSFEPTVNKPFHIKVIHNGKHIEVWYGENKDNVKKILEANDDKYKSGLFALDGWDKPIYFDNVLIKGPGILSSQGEAVSNTKEKLPALWGKLKNTSM